MSHSFYSIAKIAGSFLLKLLKWIMILLISVICLGLITEFTLSQIDNTKINMPGKLVKVNGKDMHLWCEGTDENKTMVLLDAGATLFSTSWRFVADELQNDYEVCAFDRAGLGWSDAQPEPYDENAAVEQLNRLLLNANKNEPFIYVGHSLGAMFGRIFAHRYPERVKALIQLEPADPDIFISDIAEARGKPVIKGAPIKPCGMNCPMVNAASLIGLTRYFMSTHEALSDPRYHPMSLLEYKALTNTTKSLSFFIQRGRYMPDIMFATKEANTLYDIPLAIYYGENSGELLGGYDSENELKEDQKVMRDVWRQTLSLTSGATDIQQISGANHLTLVAWQLPAQELVSHIKAFLNDID